MQILSSIGFLLHANDEKRDRSTQFDSTVSRNNIQLHTRVSYSNVLQVNIFISYAD